MSEDEVADSTGDDGKEVALRLLSVVVDGIAAAAVPNCACLSLRRFLRLALGVDKTVDVMAVTAAAAVSIDSAVIISSLLMLVLRCVASSRFRFCNV